MTKTVTREAKRWLDQIFKCHIDGMVSHNDAAMAKRQILEVMQAEVDRAVKFGQRRRPA